jgi:hypothetical protein
MPHVQSLYDEHYSPVQIRRDQRKRILDMVQTNSAHPEVALNLVRDYCRSSAKVSFVRFDQFPNPTGIIVFTEGTSYHFRFRNTQKLEAPTL